MVMLPATFTDPVVPVCHCTTPFSWPRGAALHVQAGMLRAALN
jgi:hypothetical protein